MIKSRKFTCLALLLSAFILARASICLGAGQILLEEDWETGEIDENIWIPAPTWKIVDGVLDAGGGGGEDAGFTVQNDFTDFEFSVDAKIVNAYIGFVMRAPDQDNMFMHQIGAGDPNIWFHSKIGGAFAADQVPIESGLALELDVWYRVKFIVEGDQTTCLMAELGEELSEAKHSLGTWENDTFDSGAIGFRHWAAEHGLYDNILVTTVGYTHAVTPEDRLSTAWGKIKKSH